MTFDDFLHIFLSSKYEHIILRQNYNKKKKTLPSKNLNISTDIFDKGLFTKLV